MEQKRNTTVHDIAKQAGTSATTVSRVLNNNGYPVSNSLRQKVLKVAEELNYSPNILAKSLRSESSSEIGVIIPTISNPFYASAILGIQQQLYNHGLNMLLCNTFRRPEKEREYLQILFNKRVRGVIVSAVAEDGHNIREFSKKGMDFVLLDQKIAGTVSNNILFNSREGARIATEYLLHNGHRKVALITTPLTRWTRREISRGYRDALLENRSYNIEPVIFEAVAEQEDTHFGYENLVGVQLAKQFVETRCDATAVLCVNDMVAFGFIQELHKNNIMIPRDVSVIGFDDIPFASMFSPALTTVKCFAYEMGSLAGRILVDKIKGVDTIDASLKIEPELIIRDTVRKIV